MKRKFLFIKNASYWNRLVHKFQKLHKRISAIIANTNFSEKEYNRLSGKLNTVYSKLARMQTSVGVKLAGTALALILSATTTNAQMVQQAAIPGFQHNPFAEVFAGLVAYPDFIDIDKDGDLDILVGVDNLYDEVIYFYKNTGSNSVPAFELQDTPAPFDKTFENYAKLNIIDFDNDGDKDVFIGNYQEVSSVMIISYFKNENGSFVEQTGVSNPFDGMTFVEDGFPELADIDNDGDIDLVVGMYEGTIQYFKNNSGTFVEQTATNNPFDAISVGQSAFPEFIDIDNDNDLDLFVGEYDGIVNYFQNNGGVFTEMTGNGNPLNEVLVPMNALAFADIDNDGDIDAFIQGFFDNLIFYKNTGNASSPVFETIGLDVGGNAAPVFVDIDNDNDLDLFVGNKYGAIKYYQNNGGNYVEQTGLNNPFDGLIDGVSNVTPTFLDIDNDGDYDVFIGSKYGTIKYYKNTGTNSSPIFVEQIDAANPFDGYDIVNENVTVPAFIDIDNDGDYDAFIGTSDGTGPIMDFYENTGTKTAAVFVQGTASPFEGIIFETSPAPHFVDFDGDNDLDLFVGEEDAIRYFTNNDGIFTEQTGASNPFNGEVIDSPILAFGDIDGSGNIDAFVGTTLGNVRYYKNNNLTKIDDAVTFETSIYPNPTTGILNLQLSENPLSISILNLTGKTIIKKLDVEQNTTIDLSGLENGIYIVKVQTTNGIFTSKIVKE